MTSIHAPSSPFSKAAKFLVRGLALLAPLAALAEFGLTTTDDFYTVDTDAGLVFKIRRVDKNSNTQSVGDIASLYYNGKEYQNQGRGSQVNSGFDWLYNNTSTVSLNAEQVGTNFIKITVKAGELTHYYIARKGYSHIYMATYFTKEPEAQALVRYIVRIPQGFLPNGPTPSNTVGTDLTIEAKDVFAFSSGPLAGQTRSKHYSGQRQIDWSYVGATGDNVGVFMVKSNHEGDSGGPFFRCLINQNGGDQELYEIVNYGEGQTEAFRMNVLNGPYTLVFTKGTPPPANIDTSWLQTTDFKLLGFVPNKARARVAGTATGIPANIQGVVSFSNPQAQYWAIVSNGRYVSPAMIPGTYTQTLYKGELLVATKSVSVPAPTNPFGLASVVSNIASTEFQPTVLWRIGEWDGTPKEFKNADRISFMHPSDVRLDSWFPQPYVIGVNKPADLPCYQWRADSTLSGDIVIKFNLTADQIKARTLRVGITVAFAGARHFPKLNGKWSGTANPSTQPGTRTLTVGTWRGNNTTYSWNIPASAFVVGENVLTLPVASGSNKGYLNYTAPGLSLDCIDMY